MSDIDIFEGRAAIDAASDAEFAGTTNPRNYMVSESLQDRAHTLLSQAFQGRWGAATRLAEAFSTSDFTLGAFAVIDTEMLAKYGELPTQWRQYTTVTTVNDFRPKRLMDKWRNTVGFDVVPELTEYPSEDNRGFALYQIAVTKYGRRFSLSWESWLNNEAIQELEDLPAVLAQQASETEMINAVSNLVKSDRNGVNTDFFKSANGNAPTALPLTIDNLDAALQSLSSKRSAVSNKVIASPDLIVVIPRSLEIQMKRLQAITSIRKSDGAGGSYEVQNYLAGVDYVVEPMLDYWNLGSKAATTWFILPKPAATRPALYAAFLRGHETPDLRVKSSTGQRVGGGDISPLEGSFEIDDIQYRGRHVLGRQTADPTFTYASNGS